MPETLTERLGLIKPNRDTNTPLDIERLNLNMNVLDRAVGTSQVADGVIPPSVELYDGKIVREKTSGGVWIAEKQSNGSYAKKWIVYPYLYVAFAATTPVGASGAWSPWGWDIFWGGSYGGQPTDLAPKNFWKVPFKGIFQMRYQDKFEPTGTANQIRASVFTVNDVMENNNTETVHLNNGGTSQENTCTFSRAFDAGVIVGHNILISPGANPTLYSTLEVNCIERIGD